MASGDSHGAGDGVEEWPQQVAVGWTERWAATNTSITDSQGAIWQSDASVARGGRLRVSAMEIGGTGSPALYQHDRVGVSGYTLPIPATGTWVVKVHLATTDGTAFGNRIFDIVAGDQALRNIDTARAVGPGRAHVVMLLVATTAQRLLVSIIPRVGEPSVSGISVSFVRPGTTPPTVSFSDSFDGPADADPGSKWKPERGATGWGNRELQAYTDRRSNASLDGNGHLVIYARRERTELDDSKPANFSSARLNSTYSDTYGRIAARIKVPAGGGLLPAFWMLGRDLDAAGWPESGEIDVVETLGDAEPGTGHGTLHGPNGTADGWTQGSAFKRYEKLSNNFHWYSVDWWPGIVQFSLDGVPYAAYTPADLAKGQRWVFDKPFFLLLNVAVGGTWPGSPADSLKFPQAMHVDEVMWWR